jgi:NAD-dependent dihydropyrimidine dehydrogenase PreA subunit
VRADGTFIAVEIDDTVASDPAVVAKLAEACPVDIFAQDNSGGLSQDDSGGLRIIEQNLDECVLCRLCLDATGGGGSDAAVKVIKLYDNDAVLV